MLFYGVQEIECITNTKTTRSLSTGWDCPVTIWAKYKSDLSAIQSLNTINRNRTHVQTGLEKALQISTFLGVGGRSEEHYPFFHMANFLFPEQPPWLNHQLEWEMTREREGSDIKFTAWWDDNKVKWRSYWRRWSTVVGIVNLEAGSKIEGGWGVSTVCQLNREEINRWAASFGIWDELTAGWWCSSSNRPSRKKQAYLFLLFFFFLNLYTPLPATQGRLRQNYANVILFTLYLLLWR